MLYIKKNNEPASLTKYKKQSNAYYDGFKYKDDIREALLKEQGYLCAYCMRRISNVKEVTIEHYVPQSELDECTALDYRNVLGVCKIDRERKKEYQTCNSHRGNEKLTVNPFDRDTIKLIKYERGTGKIGSKNECIDKDLNYTLNLNCKNSHLPENRLHVLKGLEKKILKDNKGKICSKSYLLNLKRQIENPDKDGKIAEYAGIMIWYINKRLKSNR